MGRKVDVIGSTIVEKDGKILLVQEAKDIFPGVKGKWNLPTGKIDPKEDLFKCSVRETKEETGLDVELEYLVGMYQSFREFTEINKLVDVLRFTFKTKMLGGELKKTDEVSDINWFSLEEIKEMDKNNQLRSEEILVATQDYFSGKKMPLESLTVLEGRIV